MANKKFSFCPLLKNNCLEEKCAWWMDADDWNKAHGYPGCCAIANIAGSNDDIAEHLDTDSIDVRVFNGA